MAQRGYFTHDRTGTAPPVASSIRRATGNEGMFRPCNSACIVLTETPTSRANALDALPCPDSHVASFSMLADWHIQKTFASPKISIAIAFRICEKQSSSKGDTQMTTEQILTAMIAHAKTGGDVYPFMWQPVFGRSNAVSAAVRRAKKEGLLVEAGKDGTGKPFYRAPIKLATHAASAAIN
jgi:hypothetical protein